MHVFPELQLKQFIQHLSCQSLINTLCNSLKATTTTICSFMEGMHL